MFGIYLVLIGVLDVPPFMFFAISQDTSIDRCCLKRLDRGKLTLILLMPRRIGAPAVLPHFS